MLSLPASDDDSNPFFSDAAFPATYAGKLRSVRIVNQSGFEKCAGIHG